MSDQENPNTVGTSTDIESPYIGKIMDTDPERYVPVIKNHKPPHKLPYRNVDITRKQRRSRFRADDKEDFMREIIERLQRQQPVQLLQNQHQYQQEQLLPIQYHLQRPTQQQYQQEQPPMQYQQPKQKQYQQEQLPPAQYQKTKQQKQPTEQPHSSKNYTMHKLELNTEQKGKNANKEHPQNPNKDKQNGSEKKQNKTKPFDPKNEAKPPPKIKSVVRIPEKNNNSSVDKSIEETIKAGMTEAWERTITRPGKVSTQIRKPHETPKEESNSNIEDDLELSDNSYEFTE